MIFRRIKEDLGIVGNRIDEKVVNGWTDNERKGKWEKKEDGKGEEMARVSVDYAL